MIAGDVIFLQNSVFGLGAEMGVVAVGLRHHLWPLFFINFTNGFFFFLLSSSSLLLLLLSSSFSVVLNPIKIQNRKVFVQHHLHQLVKT